MAAVRAVEYHRPIPRVPSFELVHGIKAGKDRKESFTPWGNGESSKIIVVFSRTFVISRHESIRLVSTSGASI